MTRRTTYRPGQRYPAPPTVRQRAADWRQRLASPGWVLLPARVFLGGTFLFAGLQKLADPHFFDPSRPTSIQGQLAIFRSSSPIGGLLGSLPGHAVAFGVFTALAEIAVGLGTLLGLWARVAALGGLLLSTSFFLTVSFHTRPYYYGSDIFAMVMWLPFVAVGAGGVLSLDAAIARRTVRERPGAPEPDVRRRTLVRGAAAAAVVAVGGGLLAAVDAVFGRLLAPSSRPPRAALGNSPSSAAAPTAKGSHGSSRSAGPVVAAVADVPVGGAKAFTDPRTKQPAYVVRPARAQVRAFSAICPHAGCVVNYLAGVRQFVCPCHGSTFDGGTGRVLAGPSPQGLPPVRVEVAGGEIHAPA